MTDNRSNFTWVETYREIVDFLKDKKDDQKSLINLLKEIGITGFNDQDKDDKKIELSEIDPFTFFCYLNKYGPEKRINFFQKLAKKLSFKNIPSDDSGLPSITPLNVWMFPFKYQRNNNEINTLWELFYRALEDKIDDDFFGDVLKIQSVGKATLTSVLFYVNPEKFFPINGPVKPYLKKHFDLDSNFNTFAEYQAILAKLREKTNKPFYEISFDAWDSEDNYWIFQGNPNLFDFEKGFKEDLIDNWTVTTHKDKIKNGDKFIICLTGKNSGCYALGEVTADPQMIEKSKDDHLWNKDPKKRLMAGIKITHNLIDKPILKANIIDLEELAGLKAGNQGTNFTLEKKEYLKFLELADSMNKKRYWLYAPGENAKKWGEFYDAGVMALDWGELGDLNQYETKQDIADKLIELDGTGSSKKNDATANYEFKDRCLSSKLSPKLNLFFCSNFL